jgi:hypothetical protein
MFGDLLIGMNLSEDKEIEVILSSVDLFWEPVRAGRLFWRGAGSRRPVS